MGTSHRRRPRRFARRTATCRCCGSRQPTSRPPLCCSPPTSTGRTTSTGFLGSRLADAGLTTLIPDLFFRVGPANGDGRDAALERRSRLDDPLALADLNATRTALVPAGRSYGLLGFCLGGSLALLAAADDPNAVTVSYYGFPRGAPGARVAAEEPIAAASRIAGAVLGIWGAEDYIDKDDIETLRAELDAGPADYQHVIYDGVGHAFLGGLTEDGPSSVAAQDAWRRTTEFFALRLGTRS